LVVVFEVVLMQAIRKALERLVVASSEKQDARGRDTNKKKLDENELKV
jgi:hypothetical protein